MYSTLCNSLNEIGVDADFVDFSGSRYFKYKNKSILAGAIKYLLYLSQGGGYWVFQFPAKLIGGVLCIFHFLLAIIKYDVFIFNYTTSLLPKNLDLPILKFFGKRVLWVFHGSDLRPAFMDGAVIYGYNSMFVNRMIADTDENKRRAQYIEKYADVIVAQPCHSMFLTKPFINSVHLGQPILRVGVEPILPESGVVKLYHAPSSPYAKGTRTLRKWVIQLKEDLSALESPIIIDYNEALHLPHDELLIEMAKSDIVVDQLYSDLYFPITTCEAIMLGKPVVIGGYLKRYPDVLKHVNPMQRFINRGKLSEEPVVYIEPTYEEFKNAIIHLAGYKHRVMSGVNTNFLYDNLCDPKLFALRITKLVENFLIRPEWYVDPKQIVYLHGCGVEETKLIKNLHEVETRRGDFCFLPEREDLCARVREWLKKC